MESKSLKWPRIALLLKQLNRQFGELPQELVARINDLSLETLDALSETISGMESASELQERLMQWPNAIWGW